VDVQRLQPGCKEGCKHRVRKYSSIRCLFSDTPTNHHVRSFRLQQVQKHTACSGRASDLGAFPVEPDQVNSVIQKLLQTYPYPHLHSPVNPLRFRDNPLNDEIPHPQHLCNHLCNPVCNHHYNSRKKAGRGSSSSQTASPATRSSPSRWRRGDRPGVLLQGSRKRS
jgi:hypothetical protein